MSLAQRVRDHRYSKGWGPDELASRAAISRTALYQIESGKTELPRAGTLRRIALALDVSMEILLGHSEAGPVVAATAKPSRANSEWVPSEGGPLTIPSTRTTPTIENVDGSRFGVESTPLVTAPPESYLSVRERELAWKLRELLSSNLGEGIARIIEESYRLLPSSRHVG
ncbi:helix-turn-helix domain-containing protein [Singulisphaera acidiphila]|uniref:Putative transcriptional regulator n=1 Tax=Singulisphaera acidiphila (strain ATCC BAA-1392 / DSM 18658 / VKM B-2454 / MOB10) TaxID=886293 RepID=L0DF52_SINAD|nr:helix-turn-helix transcriptional regulator [Singulisphaera acidiphila]AGA27306.1 putative transcriptional regulator [Singulisphaera acidiphila DSM 18658]